jgi:aromatic-L-amino-acid/L-tryptophan decarboxylase
MEPRVTSGASPGEPGGEPGGEPRWRIDLPPEKFRELGYQLVDRLTEFLAGIADRPVSPPPVPDDIRGLLRGFALRDDGAPPDQLLAAATEALTSAGSFAGHPRWWGFINGSGAPLGVLGDFLASAVNQNVSGWVISALAHEIEAQAVRWTAELLGYPAGCGGLFVTGGNAANFIGFLAARRRRIGAAVRTDGVDPAAGWRIYASTECHTWLQKAADMYGLGTGAVSWIAVDARQRMDAAALREAMRRDAQAGKRALLVIGTAGTTGTGAIDPLPEIRDACREHGAWFHVDGSYGAMAAVLAEPPPELAVLGDADSLAFDAHKWMYLPCDVACALVRDPTVLAETFTYQPPYYSAKIRTIAGTQSYNALGPDNSRGFRALKVWLTLQQVGRAGYRALVGKDIALARLLHDRVRAHGELEPVSQSLGITTFRFVPRDLAAGDHEDEDYLRRLNVAIVLRIQAEGRAFVSHAFVGERFAIRFCNVNFRTTAEDVAMLPALVVEIGRQVDRELRHEPPPVTPRPA